MTVMDETVEGIFASQIVEMNGAISGVEAPGTRLAVLNRGRNYPSTLNGSVRALKAKTATVLKKQKSQICGAIFQAEFHQQIKHLQNSLFDLRFSVFLPRNPLKLHPKK